MVTKVFSMVSEEDRDSILPQAQLIDAVDDTAKLVIEAGDHAIVHGLDLAPRLVCGSVCVPYCFRIPAIYRGS